MSNRTQFLTLLAGLSAALLTCEGGRAGDWPQFRHDASRTAASAESLPAELHLQWTRELPTPRPAFPKEIRLRYDASYEPVVLGKRMFVPSMVTDSVTALDTDTGAFCWRYFADGPVRLAPVAWDGKVYFVSDDGYLYCVSAENGDLHWKFRGLPTDRQDRSVLGNGRLISLWPARGGPVLDDGIIYFAAGIWLGDGVFVHALDARNGQVVWSNVDSNLIPQTNLDHGVKSVAGLSPQGSLAVVGDKLVVPCGAQLPAFLDRMTGKLEPYTMGWGGRVGLPKGSWLVAGAGKYLVHSGDLYDIERPNDERFKDSRSKTDFKRLLYPGGYTRLLIDPSCQRALAQFRQPVITADAMYIDSPSSGVVGYDLTRPTLQQRAKTQTPLHRAEDKFPDKWKATFPELFRLPSKLKLHVKAANRLYAGAAGVVQAIDLPAEKGEPELSWRTQIEGTPTRMLAADAKLYVVTDQGRIYAFGGQARAEQPVIYKKPQVALETKADGWAEPTRGILAETKVTDGYALILGTGSGRLAEELLRQSDVFVIAIDADAGRVASLREKFHQQGLYGRRIAIQLGDPLSYPFPPYLASLIVSEEPATVLDDLSEKRLAHKLFHALRPYGGTACLPVAGDRQDLLIRQLRETDLPGAEVRATDDLALLTRQGPLPGADSWTHHGANAANTGGADDLSLKPPLAILWFDASVRWNRMPGGAVIRVAKGRCFTLGDTLLAVDVFTGRRLWETKLPPTRHLASHELVATDDAVYVPHATTCLVLDPATGEQSGQIDTPAELTETSRGKWSHVRVAGEFLVGAVGKYLVCVNRHTGKMLWQFPCRHARLSLAIGTGRVYCAEVPRPHRNNSSNETAADQTRTSAHDLKTGEVLWQVPKGSVVRYSQQHDLLVTAHGIYRGKDGSLVRQLGGTPYLAGKLLIFTDNQTISTSDLLTGEKVIDELSWNRRGCTNLRASSTMVTTRFGGNAAYIDLATRKIMSLWNVRSGCINNLVPADGVLNVPNVTGGCECNYTPTSLALVPAAVINVAVSKEDEIRHQRQASQ